MIEPQKMQYAMHHQDPKLCRLAVTLLSRLCLEFFTRDDELPQNPSHLKKSGGGKR